KVSVADAGAPPVSTADASTSSLLVDSGAPVRLYRSDAMRFQVRFPDGKAPEVEEKVLGSGVVTAHLFKVQFGTSAYVVSVDELSPKAAVRTPEQLLEGAREGLLQSTGGSIDSEKPITVDGNPGIELAISATTSGIKMRQRARTYIAEGRV